MELITFKSYFVPEIFPAVEFRYGGESFKEIFPARLLQLNVGYIRTCNRNTVFPSSLAS